MGFKNLKWADLPRGCRPCVPGGSGVVPIPLRFNFLIVWQARKNYYKGYTDFRDCKHCIIVMYYCILVIDMIYIIDVDIIPGPGDRSARACIMLQYAAGPERRPCWRVLVVCVMI